MTSDRIAAPGPGSWALLFFLALVWGSSFMAGKIALTAMPPLSLAASRIALAALVLLAVARLSGAGLPDWRAPKGPRIWAHALGMAVFTNALPFSLLAWGQLRVTSGFAGITMAVVPLVVLPMAHFLVPGERMGRWKFAGFLLGFAGVAVLIGDGALSSRGEPYETLARLACVGATVCYATGAIVTRLCPPTGIIGFSAAGLSLAALLSVPVALTVNGPPSWPGWSAAGAAAYLGLFPTALATLILVRIVNTAGPSFLSLVNYQVPLVAVLLGALVLHEPLPAEFLGALMLILAGLALSQLRRPAPPVPPGTP